MLVQSQPHVLVLRAAGINCDEETAAACELAGARAERVHINRLARGDVNLMDYAAFVLPGGFSYGDHLGAGKLLAVDLVHRLSDVLGRFVEDGRPVLGICNGFQALVKAGLLPDGAAGGRRQRVSLTDNRVGHYECRWVRLAADPLSPCLFTRGLDHPIHLPVGHGEGRFVAPDEVVAELEQRHLVALRYVDGDGSPTLDYPANPNGSMAAIW